MAKGLGLKTPLQQSDSVGLFATTTNIVENTKTKPKEPYPNQSWGEVMDPDFGVGLRQYLFENYEPEVVGDIKMRIGEQCRKYMSYVQIVDVAVSLQNDANLYVQVLYFIPVLNINDQISILLPKAI